MRPARLALPVLPWLWLWLAPTAGAQPTFTRAETLEWMAAESPLVVRGLVVDFARETDPAGAVWDTVVVRVLETLKGPRRPFHTFAMHNLVHKEDLPRWKGTGQELLIFFTDRTDHEKLSAYDVTPRDVSPGRQAVIELSGRGGSGGAKVVYTLDLKDPSGPREVLDRTRAAVAASRGPGGPRAHQVRWPKGSGGNVDRVVPVDERLGRQARLWARSGDAGLREEGAKALGSVASAEDVPALKALLTDPSSEPVFEYDAEKAVEVGRTYPVRRAAYDALRGLGVRVPEPVLRERSPRTRGAAPR